MMMLRKTKMMPIGMMYRVVNIIISQGAEMFFYEQSVLNS